MRKARTINYFVSINFIISILFGGLFGFFIFIISQSKMRSRMQPKVILSMFGLGYIMKIL
jgi:hypothetical protein